MKGSKVLKTKSKKTLDFLFFLLKINGMKSQIQDPFFVRTTLLEIKPGTNV